MITPITPEMITRINELAKKQKSGELSEAERTEQAGLRRLYIDNFKTQVKVHLDAEQEYRHSQDCSCGCHDKH